VSRFRFEVIEEPSELEEHTAAWDDLASNALEPNLFYESWALRPALETLAGQPPPRCVLVYEDSDRETPLLCGLFPLERCTHYRSLPLAHFTLWRHRHCYLATPLLRRRLARESLAAFLGWLGNDESGTLAMEWDLIPADGPFHRLLRGLLRHRGSFVKASEQRAMLRPLVDAETYLDEVLPPKARREFKRLERRLAELGPVHYTQLESMDDAQSWVASFLELEASGWKGRKASALGSSEAGRDFFTRFALGAARRGRLMMLGLQLGDQPIALKCNFLAGDGGFTFKIAYDERYARFSPGTLLELEHIRRFHARAELRWMDSCASSDHFMMNRLWLDRRRMVTLLSAPRRFPGALLVSSLPALRWGYRSLRNFIPPAPDPRWVSS
jgi:CelD/BcsL family acetyltransferase involved in cellulose biosynthesis